MMLMGFWWVGPASLGVFDVYPSTCKFGTLRSGNTYRTFITLVNVGNDSTRFKIKQKAGSCFVVSYKPGPVRRTLFFTMRIFC